MMKNNESLERQRQKVAASFDQDNMSQMPLSRGNLIAMAVAGAVIVLGFVLMLGASSGEEFNADIFSVRRIVVGPAIAFLGFLGMGAAIIFKKKAS